MTWGFSVREALIWGLSVHLGSECKGDFNLGLYLRSDCKEGLSWSLSAKAV